MPLVEPYPLAFLSAILPVGSCQFALQRFDEASGSGSGQFWSAELADPLWLVSLSLSPCRWALAREVNAKITALGHNRSMLFTDRAYRPAAGGTPGTGVTVGSIAADRTAIALSGLPGGYTVTAGDRIGIISGSTRYFGEFVETVTATGAGNTVQIAINPPLPLATVTGAPAALGSPSIRLRVPQGGFTPFTETTGGMSSGTTLTLEQKR